MTENNYQPDDNLLQLFSSTGVPITIENTAVQENEVTIPTTVEVSLATTEEEEDIQLVRGRYKELEQKANKAIDQIAELAAECEAPRMYEVLATMINSAANLNKELTALHKNRNKQTDPHPVSHPQAGVIHHQQNIVFTGTPAELLAQIKAMNANK